MSNPTKDEIIGIYKKEEAREAKEVAAGTLNESTHATVLACTRTHVHYLLRMASPSMTMQTAWQQTDALVRAAWIWDGPPSGSGNVPVSSTVSEKKKKVA